MVWCEKEGIDYVLGLAQNDRLKRKDRDPDGDRPAVAAGDGRGREAVPGTALSDAQELVVRAPGGGEGGSTCPGGKNPRFIVTSVPVQECDGRRLYEEVYCARGDMENRIKEQQMGLFADRTSTRKLAGNQLRLYFSAFAYVRWRRCGEWGWGDEAGAGAELDPAGEIAEDRGTGPDHQPQGLVVLFRELSVCALLRTALTQVQALPLRC